jgi:hypothetical protein
MHGQLTQIIAQDRIAELHRGAESARAAASAPKVRHKPRRRRPASVLRSRSRRLRARIAAADR